MDGQSSKISSMHDTSAHPNQLGTNTPNQHTPPAILKHQEKVQTAHSKRLVISMFRVRERDYGITKRQLMIHTYFWPDLARSFWYNKYQHRINVIAVSQFMSFSNIPTVGIWPCAYGVCMWSSKADVTWNRQAFSNLLAYARISRSTPGLTGIYLTCYTAIHSRHAFTYHRCHHPWSSRRCTTMTLAQPGMCPYGLISFLDLVVRDFLEARLCWTCCYPTYMY